MKKVLLLIALSLGLAVGSANHLVIENGKKVEYVKYAEGQADTTYVDGKIAFIIDNDRMKAKADSINACLDSHTRFMNSQWQFNEAMAEVGYYKEVEKWEKQQKQ